MRTAKVKSAQVFTFQASPNLAALHDPAQSLTIFWAGQVPDQHYYDAKQALALAPELNLVRFEPDYINGIKVESEPYTIAMTLEPTTTLTLDAQSIQQARPYMAKKDIRYYLNGLHINSRHIVATDGHRLIAINHDNSHAPSVIIPDVLVNLMPKKGKITLNLNKTHAFFEHDGYTYAAPLLDGNYPNYLRVIPDSIEPVAYTLPAISKAQIKLAPSMQVKNGQAHLYNLHQAKKGAPWEQVNKIELAPCPLPDCAFEVDYLIEASKLSNQWQVKGNILKIETDTTTVIVMGMRA